MTLEVAFEHVELLRPIAWVDQVWNGMQQVLNLLGGSVWNPVPLPTVMSPRDWQRIVHDLLGQVWAILQACAPHRLLLCLFRLVWGHADPKHTDMIAKHVVQKLFNILFC